MKKTKKGFTLIELIVVIAILVILAALALPQFSKLKEESERSVCDANINAFARAYLVQLAIDGESDPDATLAKVKENNPSFQCPKDVDYTTLLHDTELTISCPQHGKSIKGKDFSKKVQEAIKKLLAEDDKFTMTQTIDSTANFEGNRTQKIKDALSEMGFSTAGTTWTLYSQDSKDITYALWAETPMPANAKAGDSMLVIRYNANTKKYTVGTTKITTRTATGQQGNPQYLALDYGDGVWKEYKDADIQQNDTTKGSYDEAYKIYQQALAKQKAEGKN